MTVLQTESPQIQVRRRRLRQWIDERFGGSQVQFIDDLGSRGHAINQGELSGLLKSKSFGEKKARKIESMAQMPLLYLNAPPGSSDEAYTAPLVAEPTSHYLWPFKRPTAWEYNNVLTESDRIAVETTASALLKARASPIKQIAPATNTASRSAT